MIRTYTEINSRFVRDDNGEIIGVEPVSVAEKMVYRNGEIAGFAYDTRVHSESDVQNMLNEYPSFISRIFRNVLSYFSHKIWRHRHV